MTAAQVEQEFLQAAEVAARGTLATGLCAQVESITARIMLLIYGVPEGERVALDGTYTFPDFFAPRADGPDMDRAMFSLLMAEVVRTEGEEAWA